MKKNRRTATQSELLQAFDGFGNSIVACFAAYVWMTRLLPVLQEYPDLRLYSKIGQNAAVETSLMRIRALDDFFGSETGRFEDDIRARDYGFRSDGPPLDSSERKRINKTIAHLSYAPIWTASDYAGPAGDGSLAK